MNDFEAAKSEANLPIIEVPAELRGLSDEEIIARSQKELHEVSGKRKKGERRPSKRERMAIKEQKAHQEAMAIFGKTEEHSQEKQENLRTAFTSSSPSCSFYNSTNALQSEPAVSVFAKQPNEPPTHSMVSNAPSPASGRVLKASFGAKLGDKPKAVIVSAADLAKQKAEERAKKIREALFTKRRQSDAVDAAAAATNPDGTPVKRPRGRPRKNPIVE